MEMQVKNWRWNHLLLSGKVQWQGADGSGGPGTYLAHTSDQGYGEHISEWKRSHKNNRYQFRRQRHNDSVH